MVEVIRTFKGESDIFVQRCLALAQPKLAIDCPLTRFALIESSKSLAEFYERNLSRQRYYIPQTAMAPGFVLKQDLNNWLAHNQLKNH